MYTNGAALISPPDLKENVSGTALPIRLVVTTAFARLWSLLSLAILMFHSVVHIGTCVFWLVTV